MSDNGMEQRTSRRLLASLWIAGLAAHAHAQQPPDAGSLQRQVEPPRTQALPKPLPPETASSTRDRAAAQEPRIRIRRINFEGNQHYSSAELEPLAASFLNRPISLAELEDAAALVAQYYRTKGWLARVLVPPQQVNQGQVTLKVVEARMGHTRFTVDTVQDDLTNSYVGGDVGNYTITSLASTTADISDATLSIAGITVDARRYDDTAAAPLDLWAMQFNGLMGGDQVTARRHGSR